MGKQSTSVWWSLGLLHPSYKQWDQLCELPEVALVEGKGKHSSRVNPAIGALQQHSQALSPSYHGLAFCTTLTSLQGRGYAQQQHPKQPFCRAASTAAAQPCLSLQRDSTVLHCPRRNQSLADPQHSVHCDGQYLHHLSLLPPAAPSTRGARLSAFINNWDIASHLPLFWV